jgi:hypothetical protein
LKTGRRFKLEEFVTYNFWEVIGCRKEEAVELVGEFYRGELFDGMKPLDGAIESVRRLHRDERVVFVSSRFGDGKERTPRILQRYFGSECPPVYFSGEIGNGTRKKAEFCKELGAWAMCDDTREVALGCASEGIYTVLFEQPWSRGVENRYVFPVRNWEEAMGTLDELRYG